MFPCALSTSLVGCGAAGRPACYALATMQLPMISIFAILRLCRLTTIMERREILRACMHVVVCICSMHDGSLSLLMVIQTGAHHRILRGIEPPFFTRRGPR